MTRSSSSVLPALPVIHAVPPIGMWLNVKALSGSVNVGVASRIAALIESSRVDTPVTLPVMPKRVAWLTPFSSARYT